MLLEPLVDMHEPRGGGPPQGDGALVLANDVLRLWFLEGKTPRPRWPSRQSDRCGRPCFVGVERKPSGRPSPSTDARHPGRDRPPGQVAGFGPWLAAIGALGAAGTSGAGFGRRGLGGAPADQPGCPRTGRQGPLRSCALTPLRLGASAGRKRTCGPMCGSPAREAHNRPSGAPNPRGSRPPVAPKGSLDARPRAPRLVSGGLPRAPFARPCPRRPSRAQRPDRR
jgi:hypothetical protein